MSLNKQILAQAANEARGLAMDAIAACNSGHLGLPLGCAEMGAVLYGHALSVDPSNPDWLNRDRFVLSAGHGSMFLYSWLHLAGYDVSLEDVKAFRTLGSKTPGHPEFGETAGVESTTGPLGQGIGNAVGMAISAKMAAAHFNTDAHTIFDHSIVCLAGDGCLQEGIAAEACALAGHLKLDNLILIYDDNDVTLDAPAEATQSEDSAARFRSYGFAVSEIDGHDMEAFLAAFLEAKERSDQPTIIIAKTEVGRGIDEVAGTFKAHGEAGVKFVEAAHQKLGLPAESFTVSEDTRTYFEGHRVVLNERFRQWEHTFTEWQQANPEKAAVLDAGLTLKSPADLLDKVPEADPEKAAATRASGGTVLNAIAAQLPLLISGSADLHGSTKNYLKDLGDYGPANLTGRNLLFGIREHAMGAIMNGFAYHGIFRASGATFLTFSDYLRPSIRLAALSHLPVFYIFTHDSVGVGQDGPTHQPVETVSALRLIPNLDVIRPGDAEETAGAFAAAIERTEGPTALILSRQNLPNINSLSAADRRQGTLRGGYIAKRESADLTHIILATGSELHVAMEAAEQLGAGARVVSLPSFERFERQEQAYRDEVLPNGSAVRIAIEAGVSGLWHKYVGPSGHVLGIDRFGLSAGGDIVMKELGISVDAILAAAKS